MLSHYRITKYKKISIFCTDAKNFVCTQGVKLSYKSYKILYFWNCPIKSYIFSKCPINPIFSTKTAIFVNSFKHFQGMGYVSQLYVRGMASALNVPSCTCRVKGQMSLEGSYRGVGGSLAHLWVIPTHR